MRLGESGMRFGGLTQRMGFGVGRFGVVCLPTIPSKRARVGGIAFWWAYQLCYTLTAKMAVAQSGLVRASRKKCDRADTDRKKCGRQKWLS